METETYQPRHDPARRPILRRLVLAGSLVIAVLIGVTAWRLTGATNSPVPGGVAAAVDFPVYYPDPGQLPAGYSLDSSSFKQAQPGVIIFSLNHSGYPPLSLSEEAPPAGSVIADFTKNSIPLHTTLNTSLGNALIGAYGVAPNLRTVASLPINNGPWLIITAPANISQADLKLILQSLRH